MASSGRNVAERDWARALWLRLRLFLRDDGKPAPPTEQPLGGARSSTFHLRMETRHRQTFQRNPHHQMRPD